VTGKPSSLEQAGALAERPLPFVLERRVAE
jgi:hypothetical protein